MTKPVSGGLFVSFEGAEGAGKTTQIAHVVRALRSEGRTVVTVREPGGTRLSEAIRALLLGRDGPPIEPWSELLLYVAARAQLVEEVIRPALARGAVVLADRYVDASVAYQGGGRRLGSERVRTLNHWATRGLRPDLTILLDLDPRVGLERVRSGRGAESLDRIEREALDFHRRVRSAYRRESRRDASRIALFDATRPAAELGEEILTSIRARLLRRGARSRTRAGSRIR